VTRTDGVAMPPWLEDDPLIHLREWATEEEHKLPGPDIAECVVGADSSVGLPLVDPSGAMSRRHARLVRHTRGGWTIQDLRSRNGLTVNGVHARSRRIPIAPGVEIGIGGLTLVAENETLVRLRRYLARIFGWHPETLPAIDLALRAIRATAYRRAPLVIAGAEDLVAVARQIHLRTTPPAAPFVVCGRHRYESDASLRVTATIADASAAFERAAGGTICVRARDLPIGYDELLHATLKSRAGAQLFICAKKAPKRSDLVAPPILAPKLARRAPGDVQRIVFEYGLDAMRELNANPNAFTESERKWVAKREASSFADIEIATLRIVARNAAGNVYQAAARLGLSHVALGNWFARRRGLK
jgi:hypothetical protein